MIVKARIEMSQAHLDEMRKVVMEEDWPGEDDEAVVESFLLIVLGNKCNSVDIEELQL